MNRVLRRAVARRLDESPAEVNDGELRSQSDRAAGDYGRCSCGAIVTYDELAKHAGGCTACCQRVLERLLALDIDAARGARSFRARAASSRREHARRRSLRRRRR